MNEILGAKILIVDDMPDNVRLLAGILSRKGFEVRKALNGVMALTSIETEPPDLILVDVNMPEMNGYELCEHLKQDALTQEIPIIFISALHDIQNVVQAFSIGGVDYITKPFRSEEVIARVNTHLSLHYLRRKLKKENLALQEEIRQQFQIDKDLYGDLGKAIGNNELELYYQPIVSIHSLQIDGFEALLRWKHPTRGMISPDEFIPIAENTGLIHPIGEWVAQTAMQQLSVWHQEFPHTTMSINVSGKQLLDPQLVTMIDRELEQTKINPDSVKLEITESAIIVDVDRAISQLKNLQEIGVKICLDDFGMGYSSLNRVQELPVNVIKIDRSFINQGNWIIANIISMLATMLDMSVIAEGIETKEQLENLRHLSCAFGQGYLFAPPLQKGKAEQLLVQHIIGL